MFKKIIAVIINKSITYESTTFEGESEHMKRWSTYFLDKLQTRYILFIKNVINKMEHGLSNLF